MDDHKQHLRRLAVRYDAVGAAPASFQYAGATSSEIVAGLEAGTPVTR
jgi:hypothetical protein